MYCNSCGTRLTFGHGIKRSKKYCNYTCYKHKPPRVVELEKEFGYSIEELIKQSEAMDCSQSEKARSLGLNRGTYRVYKEKYKGS